VAGLRHPYSHKAKKAEMKAAETNKKQAASQAMALRKVIATTQEGAKASWAHVAPAVQALYTSKLAEAESLVSKVEAGPADSCSEEIKKMKLDLTTCGSLLKSHLKTAQRYGLAP